MGDTIIVNPELNLKFLVFLVKIVEKCDILKLVSIPYICKQTQMHYLHMCTSLSIL